MRHARLRLLILNALVMALALVLPLAFHAVGLGSRFLPLLVPLLVNAFLSPVRWAALTGALAPLVSAIATGMPPLYPPLALVLAAEGMVLGGVAAVLYRACGRRVWPALIAAVVCGRAVAFLLSWWMAQPFGLPPAMAGAALLVQGLPGVALELAVTPLVVRAARARGSLLLAHDD
jgi:thiamine transporter ThiT